MKILITGGLGYIGSKLVIALENLGHDVEIFDRPRDIRNYDQLKLAIAEKDMVYHLAAIAELKFAIEHPQETYQINVQSTNDIAQLCAEHQVLLQFASTCNVYGSAFDGMSFENDLINPADSYSMSKAVGEYLIRMWGLTQGLKYNIIRFATVYGPSVKQDMRSDMCVQRFLSAALAGDEIKIIGNGKQNRNYIHIDDLVNGLKLLAEKPIVGEIINLAGNEQISINDIAQYALSFGATKVNHIPQRSSDFYDQNISIDKAKKLLSWEPKTKFEPGIKEMFNALTNLTCETA